MRCDWKLRGTADPGRARHASGRAQRNRQQLYDDQALLLLLLHERPDIPSTDLRSHVQEWSYLRGGLSTLDRDYGIFNKIHHDIGTHVLHHLFPQVEPSANH